MKLAQVINERIHWIMPFESMEEVPYPPGSIPIEEVPDYVQEGWVREDGLWLGKPSKTVYESIQETLHPMSWLSSLTFVTMAELGDIDEATLLEHPELFPDWDNDCLAPMHGYTCKKDTIVRELGAFYQADMEIDETQSHLRPSEHPEVWSLIVGAEGEFPNWGQPLGIPDAYDEGDTVTYRGRRRRSRVNRNIWEPTLEEKWEDAEPKEEPEPEEPEEEPAEEPEEEMEI